MDSKILQNIAYDAISNIFGQKAINKEELLKKHPWLNKQKATFVTLTKNAQLRGCIGSLLPSKSILEDIISNACSAAFRDLRFEILTKDEFKQIDIEISILTTPKKLEYKNTQDLKQKINIGIDGVILQLQNQQATFLPQVWQSLTTFEQFFEQLCQKAGCAQNCLEQNPLIYTYQVNKA